MRRETILKLKRLASECSLVAERELHHLNDDLTPWLGTNERIEEYLQLLDINAMLNKR